MENKIKEITKIEDFENGEVVELPAFSNGKPFVAKLKTPSLLMLCASGAIPNELLAEAQDIYEGKDMQSGRIKTYGEVLIAVAKASLVEPEYEAVKDYLSSRQLIAIYNYSQGGIDALKPFREIKELLEGVNSGKPDTKTGKRNTGDKE